MFCAGDSDNFTPHSTIFVDLETYRSVVANKVQEKAAITSRHIASFSYILLQ